MEPLLDLGRAAVFFDGTLHEPQLNHPEGIAVDESGAVWCGGSAGEVYRLPADGSRLELVASSGGYALGMAFDRRGRLYVCDLKHRTVMRREPTTGTYERWARVPAERPMVAPNFPVVDHDRGCLYVSDSNVAHRPGMGVWRLDLETGSATLWWDEPMDFANGMALDTEAGTLYVAESWGRRVTAIAIGDDGMATGARTVVDGIDGVVDGLALAADGTLYLACYAPSQIMRLDPTRGLELVIRDPICDLLCHPTNIAWRGTDLLTANLGGHHLTRIDLGVEGRSLL
jgi:gluconolactonase